MKQLELWNDNPEPWQRKMERAAHRIAWPAEEMGPNDRVEIKTTWRDATESWACGEGTCYEEGQDASFSIDVFWYRKWQDPREGYSGRRTYWGGANPDPRMRFFVGEEAVDFWMKLMQGD